MRKLLPALALSGLLVPVIGGPPVRPYQPINIWEPVAFGGSNTKTYVRDDGPALYRRSLYTFSKRTAPFALFTTFDGPTGEACLVKRETSNSALQALTTMNDIIVTEAAQGTPVIRPVFEPGDALLFDHLFLHRTAAEPTMARERYAMETWMFAPSDYPKGQIPITY